MICFRAVDAARRAQRPLIRDGLPPCVCPGKKNTWDRWTHVRGRTPHDAKARTRTVSQHASSAARGSSDAALTPLIFLRIAVVPRHVVFCIANQTSQKQATDSRDVTQASTGSRTTSSRAVTTRRHRLTRHTRETVGLVFFPKFPLLSKFQNHFSTNLVGIIVVDY